MRTIAKRSRPDTKGQVLYDPINMKYLVIANKMAVPGELEELGNESGYLKSMVQFYKTKKWMEGVEVKQKYKCT